MKSLDNQILLIETELDFAQSRLAEIEQSMRLLKLAGMYDSEPHFQWQSRNDNGRYLYLIFRQNADGSYSGPDGKRKVYIGCNESNIAEATRLTQNYKAYCSLQNKANELKRWIRDYQYELENLEKQIARLVRESKRWPGCAIPQKIGATASTAPALAGQ